MILANVSGSEEVEQERNSHGVNQGGCAFKGMSSLRGDPIQEIVKRCAKDKKLKNLSR